MHLGLDLGTSSVNSVRLDDVGVGVGQAAGPLPLSHPHPLWSKQDPSDWCQATSEPVARLRQQHNVTHVRGWDYPARCTVQSAHFGCVLWHLPSPKGQECRMAI